MSFPLNIFSEKKIMAKLFIQKYFGRKMISSKCLPWEILIEKFICMGEF